MVPKICTVDGCDKTKIAARGLCSTHYSRWRIHGDPNVTLYIRGDDEARLWEKVNKSGPTPIHAPHLGNCWEWTANRNEEGYGTFRVGKKIHKAHRVAYRLTHGEIPEGLDIDHQCRNAACVRPEHLRPVTNKHNHEHRGIDAPNTSGHRGVSFHKRIKKWQAYVTHNGQRIYLGYFEDVDEAGAAARACRNELFTHNDLDRSAA